jgi:branched-chain amino acid transport system permease protein
VIASFAGIVRAFDMGFVETQQFRPQTTFFIWTVLILGGAASIWGPIIGSMTFWFVIIFSEELLRQMVDSGWIPDAILQSNDIASVRMILMGIMLATLMIWRPQGLVGKKEEAQIDIR